MFTDQAAVVSGGARGLGKGISRAFAQRGAQVALCDINEPGAVATAAELSAETGREVLGLPADVSDAGAVDATVGTVLHRYGRIDHLVCNAGIVAIAPLVDTLPKTWDRVLAINLRGVFLLSWPASSRRRLLRRC